MFKKIHVVYESHQEQEGILSATLQENLTGVRVVKAFARQDYEMDKFEGVNQEQYQSLLPWLTYNFTLISI
jgi:ATP-binding cassette subfamily B protein